jgi:hypothetical protein
MTVTTRSVHRIHILTWRERCATHADHQSGMITNEMIRQRMQEEIDELRMALETQKTVTRRVQYRNMHR